MTPFALVSFTGWIEETALSVWLRESPSLWAFPFVLILHTIGMGFLVGSNIALDLRVLGFAPRIPLSLFEKLFLIIEPPNGNLVDGSFGNLVVETSTFDIVQQAI